MSGVGVLERLCQDGGATPVEKAGVAIAIASVVVFWSSLAVAVVIGIAKVWSYLGGGLSYANATPVNATLLVALLLVAASAAIGPFAYRRAARAL